jgi:hypothetical protein
MTDWSAAVCIDSNTANGNDTTPPSPAPTITFSASVHTVTADACDLSGQFQFPYQFPDFDLHWWHKVVINVAGVVDDSGGPVEIRFICSSSSFSSDNRIPLAFRPILVGQGVLPNLGSKADGWRLSYNGDTIVYDVMTNTVGGTGVILTWTVCAYDAALNSACSAPHIIGP